MFYTIYKTVNTVNGKYYIGKHQTLNPNDDYLGSGKLLKRAIKKYGIEHFHKVILHCYDNEAMMNLAEKILVTPDIETNYNLCDGGKGGWSYVNATGKNNSGKDFRKIALKQSASLTGRKDPHSSARMKQRHLDGLLNYSTTKGKHHSEETKERLRQKAKYRTGILNSQFGTLWITNGTDNKKIKKEDFSNYQNLGYYRGRQI